MREYAPEECANSVYGATKLLIRVRETFQRSAMRLSGGVGSRRKKTSRKVEMARVAGVVKIKRSWRSAKERTIHEPPIHLTPFFTFPADRTISRERVRLEIL